MKNMARVYFKKIESINETEKISAGARELLEKILEDEKIELSQKLPIKVHFGEEGNKTFIRPDNYNGIIDLLDERGVESFFIETNVLYRSLRTRKDTHIELAKRHGFTRIPVVIADGDHGEEYVEVDIDKNHFKSCKIGKEYEKYDQILVLSHFKGHMSAGFGGAIKQLGMGFAARGGKLDQHGGATPVLNPLACKKCNTCVENCPVDAISIGKVSRIDSKKCIGCAACIAVCPYGAISVNWAGGIMKNFRERLAEYAHAAQKGKNNIYIQFALNLTDKCDCAGTEMRPVAKDLGVFASLDPVALDQACLDSTEKKEGKKKVFGGKETLEHAEKLGLGSREYDLIEV